MLQNTIAVLRKEKGITQEELAGKLHVTRQTIIAIEKGNYTPSLSLAMDIAGFFQLPIESIFFYEAPQKTEL